MALFRIVIAATLLGSVLMDVGPQLHRFWLSDGLLEGSASDEYLSLSHRMSLLRGLESVPFVGEWLSEDVVEKSKEIMSSTSAIYVAYGLWIVALVCLILGYHTRLAALAAWLLTLSFHNRVLWVLNGGDDVLTQSMFYLLIAPAGAAWSLDAWRKARRSAALPQPVVVPPWSIRLIQIQLCCIYFFTALSKMNLDETNDYLTGETVYWVLNDFTVTRWSYAMLPVPLWLCKLATWGTIIFEFAFPFLIWFRIFRPWLLLAGIALHVSIWISMDINAFSPATMSLYAVFLPGTFLQGCRDRLRGRQRNTASQIASTAG